MWQKAAIGFCPFWKQTLHMWPAFLQAREEVAGTSVSYSLYNGWNQCDQNFLQYFHKFECFIYISLLTCTQHTEESILKGDYHWPYCCWFQQSVKWDSCPCYLFPSMQEQVTYWHTIQRHYTYPNIKMKTTCTAVDFGEV